METQQTLVASPAALVVINLLKVATLKSPNGVTFVSIKNYTNKQGEVSNQLINVGASYENAKAADIQTLKDLDITLSKHEFKSSIIDLEKARVELINAFITPNENRSNGQKEAYEHISSGLKVHNQTGLLYIYGYRINKTVLVKGEYKKVNSSALTIAKNELRKLLKTDKFVNFSLEVGNTLKMAGDTLEL
jgi:hypothetical protein